MESKGTLYLLPTPLGPDTLHSLPPYLIEQLHRLNVFIVERLRTARRFISATKPPQPIDSMQFLELNEHTPEQDYPALLSPLENGQDVGLLSEAGCPAVADPGAAIVLLAHQKGIKVVPYVGPSSILLALMASGMNGQSFCFHGYLPPKKPLLAKALKRLEQQSQRSKQTQIFIETPYRNQGLVEQCLTHLSPSTLFCIAVDLTTETEWIATRSIKDWKKTTIPNLHKRPAIFLLLSF